MRRSAIEILNDITGGALLELAFKRKMIADKVSSLSEPFVSHLIQLELMPGSQYIEHWNEEINGWVDDIKDLGLKPNKRPLYFNDVYTWLWDGPMEPNNLGRLRTLIRRINKKYNTNFGPEYATQELFDTVKNKLISLFSDLKRGGVIESVIDKLIS